MILNTSLLTSTSGAPELTKNVRARNVDQGYMNVDLKITTVAIKAVPMMMMMMPLSLGALLLICYLSAILRTFFPRHHTLVDS